MCLKIGVCVKGFSNDFFRVNAMTGNKPKAIKIQRRGCFCFAFGSEKQALVAIQFFSTGMQDWLGHR